MRIKLELDREYRVRKYVAEGALPDKNLTIEVDPKDLKATTRAAIAEAGDTETNPLDLTTAIYGGNELPGEPQYLGVKQDDPPVDELIQDFYARRKRAHAKIRAQDDALLTEAIKRHEERAASGFAEFDPGTDWISIPNHASRELKDKAHALSEKIKEAKAARRAANEREQAEHRESIKREKADWIASLGSAHLKEAFGEGYDCQRLYVTERAEHEHPEYTLDFDLKAVYNSRSCPSPQALAEAKSVNGDVVWLTTPPRDNLADEDATYEAYYERTWKPTEAVVIEDFLYSQVQSGRNTLEVKRYTLIREL